MESYRKQVLVCGGAGCISSGCKEIQRSLISELQSRHLDNEIKIVETGCIGSCDLGPVIVVYPEGVFYERVKPQDVKAIVEEHLAKGQPVEHLLHKDNAGKTVAHYQDIPFFNKQVRIALRNVGAINPEVIEDYVARDGYAALKKVLTSYQPAEVVDIVKRSGLRGRGGAGFPTGLKWELTMKATGDAKYVVCNADEGDPGAFMDRSVLEGDPHAVIEAMAIAGYTIGSNQGYVYVRAEYPLAVQRLGHAIIKAREYGALGKNIFNTGFDFDMEIRVGAGAFVCGEETALIASIEGKRGEPSPKPPFPAVKGVWGKPTLINNVETYANIAPIILKGPEWFASIGTEKSKGTKVFAMAGKINNTGLVEVPMGTTLREIIFDLGGGIPHGKKFKSAQTGGPSGGCLTNEHLDLSMDYDSLVSVGAMMGSGGLIVMDEDTCMVDVARYFLDFTQDESCGKCTPCRIGTKRMLEILTRITEGKGVPSDLDDLETLAKHIKNTALCGLGQTAPNPVLSTMKYFRDEYEAHIFDKRCPAGVCKALLSYKVKPDLCRGCSICAKNCPASAITGEPKKAHVINSQKCVKCGACMQKCPFKAIALS
ncbi:MAG TPA: NADH-quinone oxidoreductase subunit NuoF [Firmicutes bacterium]|jgi:NADP-reducing hydrogenase subunit HndC|nr:NADH-quinone oxidoreductase subunit NuoF [Bacillota bacterium]